MHRIRSQGAGTLKILIATYTFHPEIGGVATATATLAQAFHDEGHDVTVATLTPGSTGGYPYKVLRRPGHLALVQLYRQADVIVLANLSLRLGYPLLFLNRRFALSHHSESAFRLSGKMLSADWLRSRIARRARHLVTSDFVGRRGKLDKYFVTYPASEIDSTALGQADAQRSGALFVGRLEPEKGVLWLMDRWAEVRSRLGVDEIRIVGDGSARAELERRLSAGECPGAVLLGPLSRERTAAEFRRAAYVIVPSLWEEPFGLVVLEGLAAGAVTINSNRGGLPEAAGDLGFSFDPSDPDSFLAALDGARAMHERLAGSEAARDQWAARVRTHVDRFQPRKSVSTILAAVAT